MSQIEVIKQQVIFDQNFRVFGNIDNPLFMARDVADWIGHTDLSRMMDLVDEDEKLKRTLYVSGQNRELWFLTEDGLYELLMQSRKPIAKAFKKEVKKILKDLRLYGQYKVPRTYAEALQIAANQQMQLEEQKPKVLFAESVETSNTSILIGDLAKLLRQNGVDIGRDRLFEILRNKGFLIRQGESYNMPTQKSMDLGIMEIKERTVNNPDGSVRITKTPKITGKGQIYFINRYLGNKNISQEIEGAI